VKFPGSKLLYHFDLSVQRVPLDDLLRSCNQAGLTGLVEVSSAKAVGMIFYYLGGEVNALYREGGNAQHGQAALQALRGQVSGEDGVVSVYELPLDMAHLLRGITNRQKVAEALKTKGDLADLLARMEKSEHTGSLEIQTKSGSAMILLVRGRVSNTYWETAGGLTLEKGEARQRLEDALGVDEPLVFLAEFSQEVWKGRHEVQAALRSRLARDGAQAPQTDQLAAEETALRNQVLEGLESQLPSLVQAFMFDLMTGAILARRGRGTSSLRTGLLAEKVPRLIMYLRDLVAAGQEDEIELIEVSTNRIAILVAVAPQVQEAIAVLAEKSQPTSLVAAALSRCVRSYARTSSLSRPSLTS
jgi:hypothetical protein